jgi:putative hemolysin
MKLELSTRHTIGGDQMLAFAAQGAVDAETPIDSRDVQAPSNAGNSDWLEDAIYSKLVCRVPNVSPAVALAQRIFSFKPFNDLISQIERYERPRQLQALADALDLRFAFNGLENLKLVGDRPVVVFANHSTGGGNVLGMSLLLSNHFADHRILGNRHMKFLPSLSDKLIPVDPFNSSAAVNLDSLLNLRREFGTDYQALGVFPAGISSQLDICRATITDRRWSDAFLRIARHHDAVLLPVWFSGRNRLRYYVAAKLRTELGFLALAGEFMRLRGKTMTVNIGRPMSPDILRDIPDRRARTGFLRASVYELGREVARSTRSNSRNKIAMGRPVAAPTALDGVSVEGAFVLRVAAGDTRPEVAISPGTPLRSDLGNAAYRVVLTRPGRDDPLAFWQVLDWGQFNTRELDELSPTRRAFRLPADITARSSRWLEIVAFGATAECGHSPSIRQIRVALSELLSASPNAPALIGLLRPQETNPLLASLQLTALQRSHGDPMLLRARAGFDLIGARRHHDWRPECDVAPSNRVLRSGHGPMVDPNLRQLAMLGVRFGAAGLTDDAHPCILGRLGPEANRLSR